MERTLVIFKPDALNRALVGKFFMFLKEKG